MSAFVCDPELQRATLRAAGSGPDSPVYTHGVGRRPMERHRTFRQQTVSDTVISCAPYKESTLLLRTLSHRVWNADEGFGR